MGARVLKYDPTKKDFKKDPLRKGFNRHPDSKIVKVYNDEAETEISQLYFEGYITNDGKDRAGDILTLDGWELANYKDNPVVLYNHGWDILGALPIGKCVHIEEVEGKGIFARVKFFINKLTEPVIEAVAQEFLKGFSVGFIPKDGKYEQKEDTYYITAKELLEFSVVTIPCLASALGSLGVKSFGEYQKKSGDLLDYLKAKWRAEADVKNGEPGDEDHNAVSFDTVTDNATNLAKGEGEPDVKEKSDGTVIQAIIFNKDTFDADKAKAWLEEQKHNTPDPIDKDDTLQYKQRDADTFKEDSFKTTLLDDGISAVIGTLKEDGKGVNDDLRDNPPPPTTIEDDSEPLQKTTEEDLLTAMQTQVSISSMILDQLKMIAQILSNKGMATDSPDTKVDGEGDTGSSGSTTDSPDDESVKAIKEAVEALKGVADVLKK